MPRTCVYDQTGNTWAGPDLLAHLQRLGYALTVDLEAHGVGPRVICDHQVARSAPVLVMSRARQSVALLMFGNVTTLPDTLEVSAAHVPAVPSMVMDTLALDAPAVLKDIEIGIQSGPLQAVAEPTPQQ